MQCVGIDWAYRCAAWCALGDGGAIGGEGVVAADGDRLVRLVLAVGREVRARVEMMSGPVWVRDRLAAVGWEVAVAHARRVGDVAPLACETDTVDARVLVELCRRDLVPALGLPSLDDRALRERLRRRMHLVRWRASARGTASLWAADAVGAAPVAQAAARAGCDGPVGGARRGGDEAALDRRALAVIDLFDARIGPLDAEPRPLAAADPRVLPLRTIPGLGDPLGLTFAAEFRRRVAVLRAAQADRLRRPGPEDHPVRGSLPHRRAVRGRLADAALGRRRGRPPGVAADQPVARALRRHHRARGQEPGHVRGLRARF
jgi:hypothetical protein